MSTPRARPSSTMPSLQFDIVFGNYTFHLIDAFHLYVLTNQDLVPIKLSLLNRRDRRYAFRLRPTRPPVCVFAIASAKLALLVILTDITCLAATDTNTLH